MLIMHHGSPRPKVSFVFSLRNWARHRYFVHRHRFHGYNYLSGCFLRRGGELEAISKDNVWRVPKESNAPDTAKFKRVRLRLTELLEEALDPVVNATKNGTKERIITTDLKQRLTTYSNGAVDKGRVSAVPTLYRFLRRNMHFEYRSAT